MATRKSHRICLCGDGWGALAAMKGLASKFSNIAVVSGDLSLMEVAKSEGFEIAKSMRGVEADIYLCSGFLEIVDPDFVASHSVLNIHYSLLPKYRGLHSAVWSILNNERYFGLTIHKMNKFLDDGPVLYQYHFENTGQNSREVIEQCNDHISIHISKVVQDFIEGKIEAKPQTREDATWVCKRNLDDCLIDFNCSVEFLSLFFRALVEPYPLPRLRTPKYTVEITEGELIEKNYYMTNGRVVNCDNDGVWVKVSDGFLVIRRIRDATTKSVLEVNDVFKIGMRLR